MSRLLNKVLVKVHQHIDNIESETSALKAQLQKIDNELAKVSEENVSTTQITLHNHYIQQEIQITELQERLAKMLKAKHEHVFGDCLNNTMDLQIMTYQNHIREFEEGLRNTKLSYDIHMNEKQEKRERLLHEKQELEEKLYTITLANCCETTW